MNFQVFYGLVAYAFVTSVTPGPNNLMLMASGANFGFRRTIPHMLGVALGFVAMCFLVGFGLAGLIRQMPAIDTGMKVASVIYMLWLAWKIANASAPGEGQSDARPMTFLQAAAFQWVNPKAWAMALGAAALYAPDHSIAALALVAGVFGAINLPSVSVWAFAGQGLRRVLTNPARLQVFNWIMALLLVASLYPVMLH